MHASPIRLVLQPNLTEQRSAAYTEIELVELASLPQSLQLNPARALGKELLLGDVGASQ